MKLRQRVFPGLVFDREQSQNARLWSNLESLKNDPFGDIKFRVAKITVIGLPETNHKIQLL